MKGRKKGESVEAVINDAISQLRNRLWKSDVSARLAIHNADFGFARNFCGLRAIWIPATAVAALACWLGVFFVSSNMGWAIAATITAVSAFLLGILVLPTYVRQKADQYADSFFAAVLSLDSKSNEEDNCGPSEFSEWLTVGESSRIIRLNSIALLTIYIQTITEEKSHEHH